AIRMFGDVKHVSGEMRSLSNERRPRARRREHFGEVASDLRFTLRRMRRRPGFALATVVVLAVGIGANAAIFDVVDAALFQALPFPHGGEIVFLRDADGLAAASDDRSTSPPSYPEFEDWQRESGGFLASIAAIMTTGATVQNPEGPARIEVGAVSGDLLGVTGLRPLAGRGLSAADQEGGLRVVMLSERYWRSAHGARAEIVGESVDLDGESYEVIGVLPEEADVLAGERIDVWRPLVTQPWMSRGLHFLTVVGRLAPGQELAEAETGADAMAAGLIESGVTEHAPAISPARDLLVGDVRSLLFLQWGAVGILLIIVCTNHASRFIAQAPGRTREFALRCALGAGGPRLMRQLVTESLLIGIVGGGVGLALSRLATKYVVDAAGGAARLAAPGLDPRLLAFTLGLSIVAALILGLAPSARVLGRRLAADLAESVPGRASASPTVRRFSRALVGVEIAFSVVLLAGAGLMVTSMLRLLEEDPGFDPSDLVGLRIDLPGTRYGTDEARVQFYDEVLARVRALPGIASAAAISHVPLGGSDTNGTFVIPGREFPPDDPPRAQKRIATPGYFETMGIPVVSGRDFIETDGREGFQAAIISESLARRYWPDGDAVGRTLEFRWGTEGAQEIVGVVGDVHHRGLDLPVEGMIYVPQALFGSAGLSLVVRAETDALARVSAIRREIEAVDPLQPVSDIATLGTIIRQSVSTRRVFMTLLVGFAAVALLLAAVGVYAVTAGSVVGRTREIGVRLAMGAAPGQVMRMILLEEMRVILPGLAVGVLGAVALTRTLRAFLYEVSVTDPRTFVLVAGVLAIVAAAAVLLPARRAAGLDPNEVLRIE
ncbi:MAG: ABC transporter permease, partial [Gemmatimonadota bacterium]|nr:ABC transporter permease [Gemmatimonadota bacterium]